MVGVEKDRQKDVEILTTKAKLTALEKQLKSVETDRKRGMIELEKDAMEKQRKIAKLGVDKEELNKELKYLLEKEETAREEAECFKKKFEKLQEQYKRELDALKKANAKYIREMDEVKKLTLNASFSIQGLLFVLTLLISKVIWALQLVFRLFLDPNIPLKKHGSTAETECIEPNFLTLKIIINLKDLFIKSVRCICYLLSCFLDEGKTQEGSGRTYWQG